MNPIREVIIEACEALPNADGLYVAALLSLGAGHPGIISAPISNTDQNQWAQVLQSLLSDCEQVAGDMFRQLSRLGIYHRFSVTRGLEISSNDEIFDIESIYSQTGSYCENPEVMEKLDDCVKSLQSSIGVVNLSHLRYSGGGVVAHKSLPAITSNFVMRQEPWRRLLEGLILDTDVNLQRVVVVSGMGGCGKTQLCAKFIHQHSFSFDHTFNIDGSSESSIQADLVSHIRSLGPKNSQAVLDDALLYLSDPRNTRWLLFFDNVDDVEINLATFLPDCNHGCILVTTRNRHLGRLASKAEWHLELDVMSENEAVSLLQNAVSRSQPVEDQKKLPEVAEALGYLPVALAQAGAYMYENLCSPEDYLRLYKQRHDQLLKYEGHSRHKANAYAAFEVSFRRLPPEVQDFLYITSHYHFSGFPIAAFDHAGTSGFRREPFEYQLRGSVFEESISLLKFIFFEGDRWADESMHKIIRLLQSYSMASFTSGFKTKFLRMHPLFHDWVVDRIPDEKRSLFLSAAARVLTCAQGERRMDTQLLPHILFVLSSPGAKLLHINDRASLSWSVGERGDPEYAKTLWTDIYETVSKLESSQSLALASASAELVLESQGRHSEAADIKVERIEQQKIMLGDGHIDVLRSMHDLAGIYFDLNRYSDAEVLAVEVVKRRAELKGDDHLDTLSSMHLLARLQQAQGRYAEAEALNKEVLKKWKEKFGEYPVDTFGSLHELAVTYYNAGLFSEVERLGAEVIKAQKERLGEDNPSTLLSVHLLAKAYQDQDRYSDAEELEVDLVQRQRKQLGDEHHDTLRSIYDLAWNYWRQGRYSDAKQLASELLETRRRVFGEDHPDTVSARDLLKELNASRGERSEVELSV
ncbi:hypothetical protein CPB86DRAFT_752643 [Serendipita vermifera]|nr:hypothetical protein CPB86DRAFT_752643 [Serendipita vermifera]